ncbi:MAG: hypothetical protein AAFN41_11725, partial [Planctomycetota bacterium]
MNRLALIVLLALVAGPGAASEPNASGQPAERWYDTELAELRKQGRATRLSLDIGPLIWFHPFDPADWARLMLAGPPVQFIVTPPPELVGWADHPDLDDPAVRDGHRAAQRSGLWLPHEVGIDQEAFERMAGFGLSASPPDADRAELYRNRLADAVFVGRLGRVQ